MEQSGEAFSNLPPAEGFKLGPSDIAKGGDENVHAEPLPAILIFRDAPFDGAIEAGGMSGAVVGGVDSHQRTGIIGRDLIDGGNSFGIQFDLQEASGAAFAVPADGVAIGEIDLAGEKISQGIGDDTILVSFHSLQDMGMMAQDHRCAGVDQGTGLGDLAGGGDIKAFFSPVERDNDMMALAVEAGNLFEQMIQIQHGHAGFVDQGGVGNACALFDGSQKRQADSLNFLKGGGLGFGRIVSRAKICDSHLVKESSKVVKTFLPAIEGVIVG